MLRSPVPSADRALLENMKPDQLLGIFSSCVEKKTQRIPYGDLSEIWGTLFSQIYLAAEELIDESEHGDTRLGRDNACMLREFIRTDCANGGAFVINIIEKGGKIDRAALITIADLRDLAEVEIHGMTAIHLLAEACDKEVRPALIEKAGRELLAGVYDARGIPVLFSLLNLVDVSWDDVDAIARVFSPAELVKVTARSGTGRNALELFNSVSRSLKKRPPAERNKFQVQHAVKNTNMEGVLKSQINDSKGHDKQLGGPDVKVRDGEGRQGGEHGTVSASERYEALIAEPNPLDALIRTARANKK
jgi:hypothetical protein